ncbi:MAG: hypothetical protein NVS3B20_09150 [Polyangiales bacterium]
MQRRRGFSEVDGERQVLLGCGATHALFCALRSILDAGDHVILAAPYWPLAAGILHACGARVSEVALTDQLYAQPALDPAALLAPSITAETKAIYIITPNNPDGKVLTAAQLQSIAQLAQRHDLWVIADEVYADFVFAEGFTHTSIATLPNMAERTLTAGSLSKSHALAGARVGYVIAPELVVNAARRVSTHTVFNTPVIAQRVALSALTGGDAWMKDAQQHYRRARDMAAERLKERGI